MQFDLASGSGCLEHDYCKSDFSKVCNVVRIELIFTVRILLNVRSLLQRKVLLELFDKMVTTFLIVDKAVCCLFSSMVSSESRECFG